MAAIQDKQRNVAKHKAGFVDTHEILDQMVEASMCQICYRLLEKMYTATCGHSYCMNCAAVLLGGNFAAVRQAQISNSTVGYGICPVCRQEIWCAARCSEDGLEREPSLSHSIMIRDNFKALRSWAIWRKGEDDAARAAGKSIGETKCLWRLNGCDTDLDDSSSEFGNASSDTTFTEDAKEDEQYDSDEDGEGSNDEEMSSANDEEPQGTNTAGTSATILLSAQLRAVQRLHRATAQNRLIRTSRVLRTSASPPDSQGRPYVLPRNRTHLDPLPSPTSSFGSFESYLPPNIGGPNQQASICLDLEVMVQDKLVLIGRRQNPGPEASSGRLR